MRAPSPAILVSVLLHLAAVSLFFVVRPKDEVLPAMVSSVPVSIVSDVEIAAAAPDNPSDELIADDGASAPVEAPPAPLPPTPTPPAPSPPAPSPRPTPTPRPTPPRPTPTPSPTPPNPTTRPTPPRPTPPRPAAPSRNNAPSLDLDALAGPPRQRPNPGRPSTGQQGRGQASQATGPQIQAIMRQVIPNWTIPCDTPGARELRIRVNLTLSADGRITDGPRLLESRSDPVYRAVSDGALRAIRQTAPFDVPAGFDGAEFNPTFNVEQACRNQ